MPATREETIKVNCYLLKKEIKADSQNDLKLAAVMCIGLDLLEGFLLDVASIADSLRSIDNDHHGIARK